MLEVQETLVLFNKFADRVEPYPMMITNINPLTANDELSRPENLTFLWTWILRLVTRSFANHASLCNTPFSNKLSKNSENPGS